MLTRENFTGRACRRNARNRRTTAGILMIIVTDRMLWSYSSSTSTLPRNKRVIARCQEMTLMGSKPWFSSNVCAVSIPVEVMVAPLAPAPNLILKTTFKNGTDDHAVFACRATAGYAREGRVGRWASRVSAPLARDGLGARNACTRRDDRAAR